MAETGSKDIRKTLVIGLGGSGCRIALELKARMEERHGGKENYGRSVKFLFVDTAKENFTAYQPNHPERSPVRMESDEFIGISDVPLDDLIDSQENNPGMKAILPDTLYTSQIDQGAQQIRRLGRVALFYHYTRTVKGRLSSAINDLYSMRNLDSSASNGQEMRVEKQLRVYIIGSICGGTGGGTFIDVAYLIRNLVRETGKARSERSVTTIGVLLLPEAFPDIVTTGYQRIRANAYGALLDLEHFSQLTDASTPLYDVVLPEEGRVAVSGAPFTWCYLVGSGPHSLHGRVDLEPILAEALYLQVTSRLGEQLDATLDNIRPYLSLDYKGYRAFYSAMGFSQIIYPDLWLRQRFTLKLQERMLEDLLEQRRYTPESDPLSPFISAARDVLTPAEEDLLRPLRAELSRAKETFSRNRDPISYFESLFDTISSEHEKRVKILGERKDGALTAAEQALQQAFESHLNSPDEGLRWTMSWLNNLQEKFKDEIAKQRETQQATLDPEQERERLRSRLRDAQDRGLPLVGQLQKERLVYKTIEDIKSWMKGYFDQHTLANYLRDIYIVLAQQLNRYMRDVYDTIGFWERIQAEVKASSVGKPIYPPSTTVDLSEEDVEEKAKALVEQAIRDNSGMLGTLINAFGGLTASLPANPQRGTLAQTLADFCAAQYNSTESGDISSREKIKNAKLEERGAPLLTLLDGKTLGMSPRVIRVIGASDESKGELVKNALSDQNDVSVVVTDDPTAITYLHTMHGIPAVALANFEKYRGYYLELMQQNRAAIFHLDEALEHNPHDPGSIEFFNRQELMVLFARALAYGWIVRVDEPTNEAFPADYFKGYKSVFAVSDAFYVHLIEKLEARKDKAINRRKEAQTTTEILHLDAEINTIDGLQKAFAEHRAKGKGEDLEAVVYPHLLPRDLNPIKYADTLAEALEAFYHWRELSLAFRDAFAGMLNEYKTVHTSTTFAALVSDTGMGKFSKDALDNQRSSGLENRLQKLFKEYDRLHKIQDRNADSARWPLAYYTNGMTDADLRGDA